VTARPRPAVRDPERFAPVFVLATARSYSSVITAMVGRNPDLAGLPELKLFLYRTVGELDASLPAAWRARGAAHRSPGLVRTIAEFLFGDQSAGSVTRAQTWLRERAHWSGADVLDVVLARIGPRATVEKSPENVMTPAALRRLSAAYPRARYLHLTRHPVSAVRSMEEHWERVMPGEPSRNLRLSCIASWVDINQRLLSFGASLDDGRCLRVRAEDVLNGPAEWLRLIARGLGVRADEDAVAAMCHPEASPFACFAPACTGVTGGADPGFLRSPVLRGAVLPETVAQPPGWKDDRGLWPAVTTLAAHLGYHG
jgi:hypothetical protein